MDFVFLVGGLVAILIGANALTDGAAALAKKFNVPTIVIGLTVVAFGTSAPELAVSLSSALQGSADMAIGNVVGSNIFNSLVIVGCTALVAPIAITKNTLLKEIPLSVLAAVALFLMANDVLINGDATNAITRTEGAILLCFFAIFLSYTFAIARKGDEAVEEEDIKQMPLWKSGLFIVGGLVGLVLGGQWFVEGASNIARSLNVSESVIGLTLVAAGTSMPELATSIVAAVKKNPEMAIGNAIGSNLFNIFFVLGSSAVVTPLSLSGVGLVDLSMLVVSSLLLFVVGLLYGQRIIKSIEGLLLVLAYVAYMAYLLSQL